MLRGSYKLAFLFALPCFMSAALPPVANAQIRGSAHDFTDKGWSDNEICKPCHTPHNAMTVEINGYVAGKLWNHALPPQSQIYKTLVGDLPRDDALDAYSILCMGCHDGTVALDSFGGVNGSMFIGNANVGAPHPVREFLSTDLTNDHPVGASGVWPEPEPVYFNPRSTWENQTFGNSRMGRLRSMLVDGLERSVVSCATCHEPHRRGGHDDLLRIDNTSSQMCLACHNK